MLCHISCHWPKAYGAPAFLPLGLPSQCSCGTQRKEAGRRPGGWEKATLREMLAGCDLQLLLCLVAPEKQGEQGENTARLSPIPISSPDSTPSSWGLNIWEI